MQRHQRRIPFEHFDIVRQARHSTNDGPEVEQVRPRLIDGFPGDSPRIDVLSGLRRLDRKKRFSFVIERRGDWSLEQTIERQEILCCGRRTCLFVELFERAV